MRNSFEVTVDVYGYFSDPLFALHEQRLLPAFIIKKIGDYLPSHPDDILKINTQFKDPLYLIKTENEIKRMEDAGIIIGPKVVASLSYRSRLFYSILKEKATREGNTLARALMKFSIPDNIATPEILVTPEINHSFPVLFTPKPEVLVSIINPENITYQMTVTINWRKTETFSQSLKND